MFDGCIGASSRIPSFRAGYPPLRRVHVEATSAVAYDGLIGHGLTGDPPEAA